MNRDFMGIVLEYGSKNPEFAPLYEAVKDSKPIDLANCQISRLDESTQGPLSYQSPKVVKEKFGRGVSLQVNGKEYRFVSDKFPSGDLSARLGFLLENAQDSEVTKWLGENAVCYKGQDLSEGAMKDLASMDVGDIVEVSGDIWVIDSMEERGNVRLVNPDKESKIIPKSEVSKVLREKDVPSKYVRLAEKAINSTKRLFESTQAADVETPVDSVSMKTPTPGYAYEFSDGLFVVELVRDGKVYMIGPDDEWYSMSEKDFLKEVITRLDEEASSNQCPMLKALKRVFKGWAIEEVEEDGAYTYALSDGKNDLIAIIYHDEDRIVVHCPNVGWKPITEAKIKDINKTLKWFKDYITNYKES